MTSADSEERVEDLERELFTHLGSLVLSLAWLGFGLLVTAVAITCDAVVICWLWAWHFDLPRLDMRAAIGLSLLGSLLTYQLPENPHKGTRLDHLKRSGLLMMRSAVLLLFGWLATLVWP